MTLARQIPRAQSLVRHSTSLTQGSVSTGLIRFALPILYANALLSLNGAVNSMWVGHFLGEAALTATSNANIIMFVLLGAALGLAATAALLVGHAVGAGDIQEAKRVVGTGVVFFALVAVSLSIVGLLLSQPMLRAIRTPSSSLQLGTAYLQVIFCSVPILYAYSFVMSVLRGSGNSKTPFYFTLLSVALDIVLNPLLIFGTGYLPGMGIAGSALATSVGQGLSLAVLLRRLYRQQHSLCLRREDLSLLRVDWSIVKILVLKGIPISAQGLVLSTSGLMMISLVNELGVETTAALGASMQLWNYLQLPALAVGMAVSAAVAQNIGAQNWDRIDPITRTGALYSVLLTGSVLTAIQVLDRQACAVFLPEGAAAVSIAMHINRIVPWAYVLSGVAIVLFGVVRATGAVMVPLLIQTVAILGMRFALAKGLLDSWGTDAIWWSFPLSSTLELVLAAAYIKYGSWRCTRMRITAAHQERA
jgi:putative MATE family efflux protein